MKPKPPPKPITPENILRALLLDGLAGHRAEAYPVTFSDPPTLTNGVRLRREDAQPLVDAGLLAYVDSGTVHWHLTARGIREAFPLVEEPKALDVAALLRRIFDLAYFTEDDPAIPHAWERGDPASRLVLVLGENASGKSFFRRIVRELTRRARKDDVGRPLKAGPLPVHEVLHFSMEGRSGGGFMSSAVYGCEGWLSTGANSARTILKAAETIAERPWTTIAYWDEPDLGMSNGCAAGAGIALRDFVESRHPLVQATFVTSHSVPLVRQLTLGLTAKPHYVYLGGATPATLADWLVAQQDPTPISLEALHETGNRRFHRIRDILNRKD